MFSFMFKLISKANFFPSDKCKSYEPRNVALKKSYINFILYLS